MSDRFSVSAKQSAFKATEHLKKHHEHQAHRNDMRDVQQTQKQEAQQEIQRQQKVTQMMETQNQQPTTHADTYSDTVTLKNMSWAQDQLGRYVLNTDGEPMMTTVDLKNDGQRILKSMGHEVNLGGKTAQMKQALMQSTVQSKSHNFFLSKYAQVKVGLLIQTLSALGVSNEELQKLQKEALKGAVDENKEMMGEAMYNELLTELTQGTGRKARRTLAMMQQTQRQLIDQMSRLGYPQYWVEEQLLEERITQARKLKEEFVKERSTLMYQVDMAIQDGVAHAR